MTYFAHSPNGHTPAQTYDRHVSSVVERAKDYAQKVAEFGSLDGALLTQVVEASAYYHDLGKLEDENQLVLSGKKTARILPYHHWDAGAAHFLSEKHRCMIAAVVVSTHHTAIRDFSDEQNRGERAFRDEEAFAKTEELLQKLETVHNQLIPSKAEPLNEVPKGDKSVFLRLALSCLVDADHTDTAINYGKYPREERIVPLKPMERLVALNDYMASQSHTASDRNSLRNEMYCACRDADVTASISSCDSPVGSGKTTAVMAHLLNQAQKRGLQRIFVVLPYTNIIQQSVDKYREALVLPGENPSDVVAELHHRADFESEDARHLSALWRAPIVVTTAVAFFETLASNAPSALRRLHELPGSAIFVDESHAALPARLLPIAWRWMNTFADEWACYWVLASGSLCRFWLIPEISQRSIEKQVPEIINSSLRTRLNTYEQNRVVYKNDPKPKSISTLINWIACFQGPRLVILNTVQSTAVLADAYYNCFGAAHTEHISTALTPKDRAETLERVKNRLDNSDDTDWTLFATSCVEAGVNLSFRNGFRELGSLVSLLQAAGRINREGKISNSEMWTFVMEQNKLIKNNPDIIDSASVLNDYFEKQIEISPDLSTRSISSEIKLRGEDGIYKKLLKYEKILDFRSVNENFKVIDSDTCIAIVEPNLAGQILSERFNVNWRELQKNSVQIAQYKLKETRAPELLPGIYQWNLSYNSFLGYMAGIVQLEKFKTKGII